MNGKLERPGGALYYEVIDVTPPWAGEAPLIVFHHGVGATADLWAGWLPLLVDRYRIARFDTLGFGRSAVPGPGFQWSLDGLADDVLAVARAAGAERFHLVGESLGGTVALHLASRRPEELLSVTVSNASHRGGSIQRAREWRAFVAAQGMAAWAAMLTPLRLDPSRVSEGQYRWFERVQAEAPADSVLDLADMLLGSDLTPALGAIAVPALLLAPAQKPVRAAGRHGRHARAHPGLRAPGLRRRPPRLALFARRSLRPRPAGIPRAPRRALNRRPREAHTPAERRLTRGARRA